MLAGQLSVFCSDLVHRYCVLEKRLFKKICIAL
jgi:hypothetical protein